MAAAVPIGDDRQQRSRPIRPTGATTPHSTCGRACALICVSQPMLASAWIAQLAGVKEQILENDRRIRASAFIASVADPGVFRTGRDLAAWMGLVPKQNSSGGKERLGGISRAGNSYLRQMLVIGAMAVIRHAERHGTKRAWLLQG